MSYKIKGLIIEKIDSIFNIKKGLINENFILIKKIELILVYHNNEAQHERLEIFTERKSKYKT